jgi:hypothetical protein
MATITLLITLLPLNLYAEPLVDPNLPSVTERVNDFDTSGIGI